MAAAAAPAVPRGGGAREVRLSLADAAAAAAAGGARAQGGTRFLAGRGEGGGAGARAAAAELAKALGRRASGETARDNVRVVVRVRPPVQRELRDPYEPFASSVLLDQRRAPGAITLCEDAGALAARGASAAAVAAGAHPFTFDHVFGEQSEQRHVYETCARDAVRSVLQGFNASLIAYGQTGSGKTHTIYGPTDEHGRFSGELRGIIPRSIDDVFRHIEEDSASSSSRYLVRASMLQIYQDSISDLLRPERQNLGVREDKKRGVYVEGLSEWVVRSPAEIFDLMRRGAATRATSATRANEASSRSHAVFMLVVEHSQLVPPPPGAPASEAPSRTFRVGKLNLVDLAGSERVAVTGATGERMAEAKRINQSLSALGNVIAALTDRRARSHIPYRDSKLTRILESSLGGNCRTTMIATITPARASFSETLSTLKFANRAKSIRNEAIVNEDLDQKTLLRRYERELKQLREELSARNKDLVDKRRLLKLEEEKRRAERDKLLALTELEAKSRDFMQQKQQRVELEKRIAEMQSQLLIGGHKVRPAPRRARTLLFLVCERGLTRPPRSALASVPTRALRAPSGGRRRRSRRCPRCARCSPRSTVASATSTSSGWRPSRPSTR